MLGHDYIKYCVIPAKAGIQKKSIGKGYMIMFKNRYFLLLVLISISYIGCGSDESSDDQSNIPDNSKVDLVGIWNLISYGGNTLPFVTGEVGTKKAIYSSQKMTFNDNGTFITEMVATIQDYEDKPVITTLKGTYSIIDKDTISTQLTDIIFTMPDEIKEFYKSVGIDIDKEASGDQITKESYEPKISTFDLSGDILTMFGSVKDETGKENLEKYIYRKAKNQ